MPAPSVAINLLPKDVLDDRRATSFLNWSLTYGRYIIIVTELVVLLAFFSRFRLDQELSDLHTSINQKQAIIGSVEGFDSDVRKLQNRLTKIKQLDDNHALYIDVLDMLDQTLPPNIVLTQLKFSTNHVELSADDYSRSGFSDFLRHLRTTRKTRNITVTNVAKGQKDNIRLTFRMNFDIVPEAFK